MTSFFPKVPLGSVLKHRKDFFTLDDTARYKRARAQLHNKGIVLRDVVHGSDLRTKKQQATKAGDLLVAEIDAKVGGFGIVPPELEGAIVSSHYFLYEIDETKCLRGWLGAFIRSGGLEQQVTARGSTNYAAIRPEHALEFEIPLPSLAEQRRIVARIHELTAEIDEARGLRRQGAEEADAFLKATARRLLAKVDVTATELRSFLDRNREGIQTGPFGVQLGSADFVESGIPVLTIGNVQYGGLRLDNLKYVSTAKAKQLDRYKIKGGDILFARMGTVGRCCIVPQRAEGWVINYHIIRVALDKRRVEPRYIHWTIRASAEVEGYLDKKIRGATRQGVNSTIVSNLPCRVPTMAEQRRIVAYLGDLQAKVDSLKKPQAETAAELDALLPSILDKGFKGEL